MRELPDITSAANQDLQASLQWVGMEDIAVPILLPIKAQQPQRLNAKASVYVDLVPPETKGIHMSRLHLLINGLADVECRRESLEPLLDSLIESQQGIASAAKLKLEFDLNLKKTALLSQEFGYQSYPLSITLEKSPRGFSAQLELTIAYSSTCPCSASLARQLHAEAIDNAFAEAQIDKAELLQWAQSLEASIATPHSQRSYAYVKLQLQPQLAWPDLSELIFQLEEVIGTPVQTAVKRSDEQEFARLNASNLMFCEDAARRLKHALEHMRVVEDYWFKVEHQESLHAHNAVVIDFKEVKHAL